MDMKEYFAVSCLNAADIWDSQRLVASISLGTLTEEEGTLLHNVLGDEMDWTRPEFDVSIISESSDQKKFLQAKMLAKRFFQDVYRHLKDVENRNFCDSDQLSETDCPYYFQSLKSAYEAACIIQKPQRLPDFDVLFQGPKAPPLPFKIEEAPNGIFRVVVAGYEDQALQQWANGVDTEKEWVPVSEAAKIIAIKDGRPDKPYKLDTLQGWRSEGDQPTDAANGCDSRGHEWRYAEKGNLTEYLLSRIDHG